MKRIILPVLLLVLASFSTVEFKLSDADRQMAIAELQRSQNRLLGEIEGLSEAQLNYLIGEDAWSIAGCVEHIVASEESFGEMLKGALKTPANPAKRSEVVMSDDEILANITSRENKVKTSADFEPSGKFGAHSATITAFMNKRAEHIEYLKNTEDDLRNHYGELPYGTIDGVQILLSMSSHTERHVKQIEEIKSHPLFPKK
ncbi:MAG: DinB family protein [Bacteroidota bacterium]